MRQALPGATFVAAVLFALVFAPVSNASATSSTPRYTAISAKKALTAACMVESRDAKIPARKRYRFCTCVVGKFMRAHRQKHLTVEQLIVVAHVWRGKRDWPDKPENIGEFDFHAKSRCAGAYRI